MQREAGARGHPSSSRSKLSRRFIPIAALAKSLERCQLPHMLEDDQ
jgi:hypothetical protein